MVDKPKPYDTIEVLIGYLVAALNLTEVTFGRYPRDGNHILVGVKPHLALNPGFRIENLENHYLIPHEQRYRPDVLGSTTDLISLVRNKDGVRHIPIIDFMAPSEVLLEEQVAAARRVMTEHPIWDGAGLNVLVFSGRGLHFYGIGLMFEQEWRDWMLAAREHPLVGLHYPTYRLREGFSSLRVGVHPQLHPFAPIVADVWE
jgi:hypothetical protein